MQDATRAYRDALRRTNNWCTQRADLVFTLAPTTKLHVVAPMDNTCASFAACLILYSLKPNTAFSKVFVVAVSGSTAAPDKTVFNGVDHGRVVNLPQRPLQSCIQSGGLAALH
jgi:hypothetical protein